MSKKFGNITAGPADAFKRKLRVRKEDSAFVYCILEAHDGIVSYSTLKHQPGDPHRDLELQVPALMAAEAEQLILELGDLAYELDP